MQNYLLITERLTLFQRLFLFFLKVLCKVFKIDLQLKDKTDVAEMNIDVYGHSAYKVLKLHSFETLNKYSYLNIFDYESEI